MLYTVYILIIGFLLQFFITFKVIKKLITPKLTQADPVKRFRVRQFFIEQDKTWVWAVYDTKFNDFARSSGYFRTFSQEADANNLAKLYERTGGPVQ